jgi:hypothetical protein
MTTAKPERIATGAKSRPLAPVTSRRQSTPVTSEGYYRQALTARGTPRDAPDHGGFVS